MKRILLLLAITLGFSQLLYAQGRVTGKVISSADNEPLPGVNVIVRGTNIGAVTNFNGEYTLELPEGATQLAFSFIGFGTMVEDINGRTIINVSLIEDAEALNELVVVGYGTEEKQNATVAVESIKSEDFVQGVISSPEQLIQGKSAGVQITQASGEPGGAVNIRIRGTASVRGNNNPLFVVDGVPLAGDDVSGGSADIGRGAGSARNPLNFLNPDDIASIDILKDASATAIYGSRGANGVVIITTKSGRGMKNEISYSAQASVSNVANTFDLLNAEQFLDGITQLGGDADAVNQGNDTDWQDEIFRTAISTKHDLAFGTSYGDGSIRVGGGYQLQNGVVEETSLRRLNARANWNHTFAEKFHVTLNSTIANLDDEQAPITNNAGFEGDLLGAAYIANPTWSADPTVQVDNNIANPNSYLEYYEDIANTTRYLVNGSIGYDILPELSAKLNLGYDRSNSEREGGFSRQLAIGSNQDNGNIFLADRLNQNQLLEFTLSYDKDLGNSSSLRILGGYSYQEFRTEGRDIQGFGFQNDAINTSVDDLRAADDVLLTAITNRFDTYGKHTGYIQGYVYGGDEFYGFSPIADSVKISADLPAGVNVNNIVANSFNRIDELQSFFGRVNYNIAGKYLFTGTLRVDGSTRFGGNNRYGTFPSASFAWRISDEDFAPDAFSNLKLRVGYGVTGNQEIPYNRYLRRQRFPDPAITNGVVPAFGAFGLETVAFDNPDLQWEETSQFNLGVDFGFGADERINGSIDFYRKNTTDLLVQVFSAQPSPQPFRFVNLDANVINQGAEVILNIAAIENDDLLLDFNFNASYNSNEVTNYDGPDLPTGAINGQGLTGAFVQQISNNQPLFSYYTRPFTGLENGLSTYDPDAQVFLDKGALPKVNLGLNTTLRFGDFDVSAYLYGLFGHYIYNNTANAYFNVGSLNNGRNVTQDVYNNIGNELVTNAPDASSRYLEKGDFVRLQNLNFGYNVPVSGAFNQLRLYVSGQNLFVITGYSGVDPEVSTDKSIDDVPSAGIDYTAYPRARTFTFGLNASF